MPGSVYAYNPMRREEIKINHLVQTKYSNIILFYLLLLYRKYVYNS